MSNFTRHGGGIQSKVRKRDGKRIYYIRVWWQGKHRVEKAGATMQQAQKYMGQRRNEIDNGTYKPASQRKADEQKKRAARMTFGEIAKLYVSMNWHRWKRPNREEDRVGTLVRNFGDICAGGITQAQVVKFLADRRKRLKPSTVNMDLQVIKAVFASAVEMGAMQSNPAKRIHEFRVDRKEKNPLTEAQRKAIIAAADPELAPVIRFALLTGMRVGEISSLEWRDVDLNACTARIRESKTDTPRTVPLTKDVIDVVKSVPRGIHGGRVFLLTGRPLVTLMPGGYPHARYGKPWRRACKAAGVEGVTFHITRHTFASEYVMRGGHMFDLCKICGWATYAMVEKTYGHLQPEYLRKAIRIMDGAAG